MKTRFVIVPALIATIAAGSLAAKKQSDPVLMTIGGKDVKLSEFEYLYNKNASQQLEPQSLEQYVDMFVTYKLKVLDAENSGLDTLAAFRQEFDGYLNELSEPYLKVSEVDDSIRRAAYAHYAENVDVSHIMFAPGADTNVIDSVYNALKQGADFATLAARYSIDRSGRTNGGRLGNLPPSRTPYVFEEMAYTVPVDSISKPFATPVGIHILKVNSRTKGLGQVKTSHILKLTRDISEEQKQAKKHEIDSIHEILEGAPLAAFHEMAKRETEDPSGTRNGGDLPWFGVGMMVPEFEKAAFSLAPGELSEVIETPFGYHIIYCEDRRDQAAYEDVLPEIENSIAHDERSQMARNRFIAGYRSQHPELASMPDSLVVENARENLVNIYPEYANLLNEYRDGMLLYEASTRNVWGKVNTDIEGLKAYFEQNRDKYTWDAPRYKGYVILASSDSIANEVNKFLIENQVAPEQYSSQVRRNFGASARVDKVLAAKGENPIVDYVAFGAEAPGHSGRMTAFMAFDGRMIEQPEEPQDVRGTLYTDYQKLLEDEWVASLKQRYPVKIYKKVLKKVK